MKPEHTKPFCLEDAKAGALYCQENSYPALIGIWEGRGAADLIGEYESTSGGWYPASWRKDGSSLTSSCGRLVMLPLGYCEGKPVFVGDELVDGDGRPYTCPPNFTKPTFEDCTWPRKEPVMPNLTLFCYPIGNVQANRLALENRAALESYWKALDEYNEVKK